MMANNGHMDNIVKILTMRWQLGRKEGKWWWNASSINSNWRKNHRGKWQISENQGTSTGCAVHQTYTHTDIHTPCTVTKVYRFVDTTVRYSTWVPYKLRYMYPFNVTIYCTVVDTTVRNFDKTSESSNQSHTSKMLRAHGTTCPITYNVAKIGENVRKMINEMAGTSINSNWWKNDCRKWQSARINRHTWLCCTRYCECTTHRLHIHTYTHTHNTK